MKKIIGKIDKADFPELFLSNLNIKVDTGAYTSVIHSHSIKEVEIDGEKYIKFKLLDPSHPQYRNKEYIVKQYKKKIVKSSFGKSEQRFIIKTNILIFDEEYPIELSLSERCEMKFPILLGRKLLNGRFIVDTSKSNLSFKLKQNKNK
ncbi:MAG: ATP-dependent zinc protease [Bacteroidales bacterium]|nr:ATP-dependent zinc protease [Bacteroidales bacterium]